MSSTYIDEDGKEHEHSHDLRCYWCNEGSGRLYQQYRAADSAPLNVDFHGVLCESCLVDERLWRYERAAKARQRQDDARRGF